VVSLTWFDESSCNRPDLRKRKHRYLVTRFAFVDIIVKKGFLQLSSLKRPNNTWESSFYFHFAIAGGSNNIVK